MTKTWNRCVKRVAEFAIEMAFGVAGFVAMCLVERLIVSCIF